MDLRRCDGYRGGRDVRYLIAASQVSQDGRELGIVIRCYRGRVLPVAAFANLHRTWFERALHGRR